MVHHDTMDIIMADDRLSLILGGVGVATILLCSLPSILKRRSKKRTGAIALTDLYSDEDGTASRESEEVYEKASRLPLYVFYVGTVLGLAIAVASAVYGTLRYLASDNSTSGFLVIWLDVAAWALILLQAISIAHQKAPTKRHDQVFTAAISTLVWLLVLITQNGLILQRRLAIHSPTPTAPDLKIHIGLAAGQVAAAIIVVSACISVPRRPAVFLADGRPVDLMSTGSTWSRFTYSWVLPFLAAAAKNPLKIEDLDRPENFVRSQTVHKSFNVKKRKLSMLKLLVLAHWPALMTQLGLDLITSVMGFGPQYALFNLLRELEARGSDDGGTAGAWSWVVGLALFLVIRAWLEHYMAWISLTQLMVPVRAQLTSLIFEKSMHKKDVKEVKKEEKEVIETGPDGKQKKPKPEDPTKTKQSTINLVSVDSKRVSEFFVFFKYFPEVAINAVLSITFLVGLIGWIPLLSGVGSFALLMPLNILVIKRYGKIQKEIMAIRDKKTTMVTEALKGMRQIKFGALENQWQEKIMKVRNEELGLQWKRAITETGLILNWRAGPLLLSTVALSVYAYREGELTASVAFTTMGVFGLLEGVFTILPQLSMMSLEMRISVTRISKFLFESQDKEDYLTAGDSVCFEDATLSWPSDNSPDDDQTNKFVLQKINLAFPNGQLSVISGETGSGKSLILSSIVGEGELLGGVAKVPTAIKADDRFDKTATGANWILPGSMAFVAQIPFIENGSLKDNILFGLPLDETRYQKTVLACALEKDLEMLTDGDATEIGANGINLSGGQRWRVTLARALYSRAGILVLDDIFSAVDAHVGRWIFENALTGELSQGRTRILATHHAGICISKTAYAVQLGDGTVKHAGPVAELKRSGTLKAILEDDTPIAAPKDADLVPNGDALPHTNGTTKADEPLKPKKFVEDETKAVGSVKSRVYLEYFRVSGGFFFWGIAAFFWILVQSTDVGRGYWVKIWTSSYQESSSGLHASYSHTYGSTQSSFFPFDPSVNSTVAQHPLSFYLIGYFTIGIAMCLFAVTRSLYVFTLAIRGSRKLFEGMLATILRTPLRWVDTVPIGRILNRFTSDFNTIDSSLASNLSWTASSILSLCGIMAAALFVSPIIIIFGVILLGCAGYVARFYLHGAREAKRLESIAKSPVFEQLGSAIVGVATIRAFDKTEDYVKRIYDRVDDNTITAWHIFLTGRWMSYRLSMIGAGFTVAVAVLVVSTHGIDAALAGFALSFSLQFASAINMALRFYTTCELDMNAAERVIEYVNLPTETQDGADVPAGWPSKGAIKVKDLVVGYAPDLPAVLKGLSFEVESNMRVGIVGRTGAGKSSLALALYRFLDAREGSITIDGLDISKIRLYDLRSRLAIIPQDPTIFSGTVRSNLDPFGEATDEELREALRRVHLIPSNTSTPTEPNILTTIGIPHEPTDSTDLVPSQDINAHTNANLFDSLTSVISDNGLNLSQGQRQLLCLARAIIRRSKIMILDEATSAVDKDMDVLIQRSIREEFEGSTLLVVAHRLSTVVDFDRILVMGDGKAEEWGTPAELYAKGKGGAFWGMVQQSGDKELLEGILGGGKK